MQTSTLPENRSPRASMLSRRLTAAAPPPMTATLTADEPRRSSRQPSDRQVAGELSSSLVAFKVRRVVKQMRFDDAVLLVDQVLELRRAVRPGVAVEELHPAEPRLVEIAFGVTRPEIQVVVTSIVQHTKGGGH